MYVRYSVDGGKTMVAKDQGVGKYIGVKITNEPLSSEDEANPATYAP
jgi:hypothetical protein